MPRKRMIDPEFWSDEEIGSWSYQARLFYIGLWNFADDAGRFKAHDKLLKAQIFPYDEKLVINKLKIEIGSKIQWYSHEGAQYGYIHNFLRYQRIDRPTESKLPLPGTLDETSTNNQREVEANISKVNISKDNRSASQRLLTDEDFLKSLKDNPAYKHIDIPIEMGKMDAWLSTRKGRQKTRRFVVNWLNKIDKSMSASPSVSTGRSPKGIPEELREQIRVKK